VSIENIYLLVFILIHLCDFYLFCDFFYYCRSDIKRRDDFFIRYCSVLIYLIRSNWFSRAIFNIFFFLRV